jgi:hypothetical protein
VHYPVLNALQKNNARFFIQVFLVSPLVPRKVFPSSGFPVLGSDQNLIKMFFELIPTKFTLGIIALMQTFFHFLIFTLKWKDLTNKTQQVINFIPALGLQSFTSVWTWIRGMAIPLTLLRYHSRASCNFSNSSHNIYLNYELNLK